MPYLTANQTDTAVAKASDFGEAKLYMLPDDAQSPGNPNPEAYGDIICVFADKPHYAIRIKPDGTWTECRKVKVIVCHKA